MALVDPFHEDQPLQTFVGPLLEIEALIVRLQDQHVQLTNLAAMVDSDDHRTVWMALAEACRQVRIAIDYASEKRLYILLCLRQALQSFMRRTGRLPTIDVHNGQGG
eukprot:s2143_g3.t1